MYSAFTIAKKFAHYYLTASNGKGHGVHSPFVFDFIVKVLNDKHPYDQYRQVEELWRTLKQDHTQLQIEDFGAGSVVTASKTRKVSSIAATALKPPKYGKLMHRMIKYYGCKHVLELGTSLGVTTSYLATANKECEVMTFEGSGEVADVAEANFKMLGLQNIQLVRGNFDVTLQSRLRELPVVDFAFVDGNHRKDPTIAYFHELLQKATDHSVFIFDDIHWSAEMEEAWNYIQQHQAVTLTIDLFFIGIVYFRKEQKVAQHFTIRF